MAQKPGQEYKGTPQDKQWIRWPPTANQFKWTVTILVFLTTTGVLIYLGYGQGTLLLLSPAFPTG